MHALFVEKERDKEGGTQLGAEKEWRESARAGGSHDSLDLRMEDSKLNEMSRCRMTQPHVMRVI